MINQAINQSILTACFTQTHSFNILMYMKKNTVVDAEKGMLFNEGINLAPEIVLHFSSLRCPV